MKKSNAFFSGFILLFWSSICVAEKERCFARMPGDEGIAYDTPDAVKITKLKITPAKKFAYIATEYIGTTNLQATLYLKKTGKYCLSGGLGAATDFKIDKSIIFGGFYGVEVISNSGEYKFLRRFAYDKKYAEYKLFSCQKRRGEGMWGRCSISDER